MAVRVHGTVTGTAVTRDSRDSERRDMTGTLGTAQGQVRVAKPCLPVSRGRSRVNRDCLHRQVSTQGRLEVLNFTIMTHESDSDIIP